MSSKMQLTSGSRAVDGKFQGRFFCLYLIGTLHATTDHGELVPEEGRLVLLLHNGIRIVSGFVEDRSIHVPRLFSHGRATL